MTPRRASEFAGAPWRADDDAVLGRARMVPTMLAQDETLFYHWIMSGWARGSGAVVDLGCFAGGSTACLAEGHYKAGLTVGIHAYDRFTASEALKRRLLYPAGVPAFDGPDILPTASRLLQPWFDHVELHPGEIESQIWTDGPVEVLVMDASKTAESADRMAQIFFPHLIPGQSLVVQQDYLHWRQPWVAAQMARLSAYFQPVAFARNHTVAFLSTKPITPQALDLTRCANIPHQKTRQALFAARRAVRFLKAAPGVVHLIHAHAANPGVSKAWEMQPPGQ